LPQQEDLFFIAPGKGWETSHGVNRPLRVPMATGAWSASRSSLHKDAGARRALAAKRFSEMRLEAFANADGSSDIRVELVDASPEAAEKDVEPIFELLHDFFADVWAVASALGNLTGASGAGRPARNGAQSSTFRWMAKL